MVRYLQLDDVLRQVQRLGFVLRDAGLLAAALARPQASVFGEDAYRSLWEKAAALCQSIDNNQSLIDGNKRLAWLTTKVFLAINGQRLMATAAAGEEFMVGLVAGHASLESITRWLEEHSCESAVPELPADDIDR
ncbi:MAG TPA: Fic family protein [Jatrophihabitans sp.]|uniref:type II toxin-antitoxin system death-on-curing family toxin n=1 Tax=Jatrophihabitans sp. TaxID=1932789 RepID=UPI002EEB11EE